MTDRLMMGKYLSEEVYVTGTRQVLVAVHDPEDCKNQFCVIHSPSRHPLVNAPIHWRVRTEFDAHDFEHLVQVMERICTCGVFHPDPDDIAFITRTKGEEAATFAAAHECCDQKCCRL